MANESSKKRGFTLLQGILCILFAVATIEGALYFLRSPSNLEGTSPRPSGERKILFYRNPMNPAITSQVPAKDEMGMDYIAVYEDEGKTPKKTAEQEAEDFFASDTEPSKVTGVPGLSPITLSSREVLLAGVVTAPAVRETLQSDIRTVGRVVSDETRIKRVQTKVSGWVEKLDVNYTGQRVRKDDPVLSIYSPELLSSQEEFLQALRTAKQLAKSSDPETRKFGDELQTSARQRLRLFDVPDAFIHELEKEGKTRRAITLMAPVSGFVMGKAVFEGQQVEPGQELFVITDLSRIWVEADFYEYEASTLQTGQEAVLTSSYDPDLNLTGSVSYIYPFLNPERRTLTARMEFSNDHLLLKPGMFVDVSLKMTTESVVVIPASAVMDSGVRKVVFVSLGDGRFEPREIRTGVRNKAFVQVLSGVEAGENVAVKANFLLDSESRLQAIIQGLKK